MKSIYFLIILISSILLFTFLLNQSLNKKATDLAIINGKTFNIEIAKTDKQKNVGLAKYKSINKNFAMYFPFNDEDYYAFWMKDMKFPIDIIYINKTKIVDIFKNAENPKNPNSQLKIYKPKNLANSVLEIQAGLASKYNFQIGDKVKIIN